jgi:hypothetical protein
MRSVPDGQMLTRGLRVMHGVLHVERNRATCADARPDNRQSQGKNARKSHPRKVPLKNGLRAMLFSSVFLLCSNRYPTRFGHSM